MAAEWFLNLRQISGCGCIDNFLIRQAASLQTLQLSMSQKKKLLDFLANVPAVVASSASTSLSELKRRTAPIQTTHANGTPAFGMSQRQIMDEEPAGSSQGNQFLKKSLHEPNPPSGVEPSELNIIYPKTLDNKEQQTHFNMNSVLTERSEVEGDAAKHSPKKRLEEIEEEKIRIQQELKGLDKDIKQLKDPKKADKQINLHKKYKEISEDPKAFDQAQKLVIKLAHEKKALHQRRQKQQRDKLEQIEKEAKEKEQERLEELERLKQEKRDIIMRRITQEHKKREERRLIQQQSNALIRQIKKEQSVKIKPSSTSLEMRQLEAKKKLLEKKRNFDFAEIEEHQKRYKQLKAMHVLNKSEQPHHSISVPKYPKGMFLEKIQQEEKQRKQLQKMKDQQRRAQVEKRLKYGELVKKIFLPPKPKKSESELQPKAKPPTPDLRVNGPLEQPQLPRKTYTNSHDHTQRQSLRMKLPELAKATGSLSKISQTTQQKKMITQNMEERSRLERERQQRQRQLRKETKERLKHAQQLEKQRKQVQLPKVKKYENYLEKLPKTKQPAGNTQWKKIIEDEHMSKQQKYKELMSKATMMENKAKFKEEMAGTGAENQEAMNLIIGSIQAKLALLDKF